MGNKRYRTASLRMLAGLGWVSEQADHRNTQVDVCCVGRTLAQGCWAVSQPLGLHRFVSKDIVGLRVFNHYEARIVIARDCSIR